ncbi:MAG TPA: cation diffusion facilitator family transporter [Myxococcaceae bacterium]|nr:cation diffusion facilitator family transporter [Myxococcaceae bacterium]
MRWSSPFELPPEKVKLLQRARRLEAWTLLYLTSAVAGLYATLGSSQAMKAAWLEDLLSFVPPLAFLVAGRVSQRAPSAEYPYGYHRATTVAYLCGALALLGMGLFLLFDSITTLAAAEHPTIGSVSLLGRQVWLGWLMLPALLWSAVPVVFLGRAKLPLAESLHDKVLHADAMMNKADWMTAGAAFLGVLGIAAGWWWADSVAAGVISLDIARDGFRHLRTAVGDLMDRAPRTVDSRALDTLPARMEEAIRGIPWVKDARARVREDGHVYFADVQVVVEDATDLLGRLERAASDLRRLDWRLHEVLLVPVQRL